MTAQVTGMPSTLRTGLWRGAVEVRGFTRRRDAMIFTVGMPALLMLLLGFVSDGDTSLGAPRSHFFAASIIAYGIVSTAFITMGVGLAADREDGTLKRLRGTPVPLAAYLIGKVVLVAAATAVEVVVMVATAVVAFNLPLPSDPGRWVTLGWLLGLSVVACATLGMAVSALVRSARSAGPVLSAPVVSLQFLSGIFMHPITALPVWMTTVASFFPVKWMGQGLRSVFLPAEAAQYEVAGGWELGRTALVLGAWCVIGLLLCLASFRWMNRRD